MKISTKGRYGLRALVDWQVMTMESQLRWQVLHKGKNCH